MSTANEIKRLQDARDSLRAKAINLGIADSTAKLDQLATAYNTIENKGAVSAEVKEGETYTIPKGYHDGSGTVSGVKGGGNYSLQSKSVTPTKVLQAITSDDGFYGLSDVTVQPIPDIYQDVSSVTADAPDVLAGKVIVDSLGGVKTGTMANNGAVTKKLDVTSAQAMSYTIPAGYHNGEGVVNIESETQSATPTKSAQTLTANAGKVISSVTVEPIPDAYQDVTGVTATPEAVLVGNDFVDAEGNVLEGTMANNGAVDKTLDTNTTEFTVPAGYHNGEGSVKVVTETKSATPTKSAQTVSATAGKVLASVDVAPIPDEYQVVTNVTAEAGDVLAGKVIVEADGTETTGTMANNGAVAEALDTTKTEYTVPAGFHNGEGKVAITLDEKSVTPTKAEQVINPGTGKVLSKVTVAAIPAAYQDVTSVTAGEAEVLVGKSIVDATGKVVAGTMANNGDVSTSMDGLTANTVTIPAGFTTGGTISLTSAIEEALAAI